MHVSTTWPYSVRSQRTGARGTFTVTESSLYHHCTSTAPSLSRHCTITAPSRAREVKAEVHTTDLGEPDTFRQLTRLLGLGGYAESSTNTCHLTAIHQ